MRPQRASRAMSTIGPNVQSMPTARASLAAMDWACSIIAGSQLDGGADRRRENCAIAVDDVEAEENRDVEARFFYGDVLEAVDFFWIGDPEHRTGAAFFDDLLDFLAVGVGEELRDRESGELRELSDFFVEGHLLEEVGWRGILLLLRGLRDWAWWLREFARARRVA